MYVCMFVCVYAYVCVYVHDYDTSQAELLEPAAEIGRISVYVCMCVCMYASLDESRHRRVDVLEMYIHTQTKH